MHKLRIMDATGDTTVTWDTEAEEAVKEAERLFEHHRKSGATAFSVSPKGETTRITRFDPEAQQIVMIPRIAGG